MAKSSNHSHWVERLWLAAASVPNQKTSLAHWKILLGEDFEAASRWLIPTRNIASAVPGPKGMHQWLRVVEVEPFRYVGFDDQFHQTVTVERADVTVFGIDWQRVIYSLCEQTRIAPTTDCNYSAPAWHWGTAQPQIGFAFPFYFGSGPLLNSLSHICDQTDQPFVLLRLSLNSVDGLCGRMLKDRRGMLLPLTESTIPGDQSGITFSSGALERIDAFQSSFLPKLQSSPQPKFPTPPKCTWSTIKIRFLDIDTVSITAENVVGRFHYTEMGFARASNKRSNVQWELLRSFSRGYGTMTWNSPGASRQNQKRKERLSETLCQFFGIENDPIRWMPDRCGWQTLFALDPEP